MGNGQFGVWSNAGAQAVWGQNTVLWNALGEKGGQGELQGWQSEQNFQPGDECAVWSEEYAIWLPARVLDISEVWALVSADASETTLRTRRKQAALVAGSVVASAKKV